MRLIGLRRHRAFGWSARRLLRLLVLLAGLDLLCCITGSAIGGAGLFAAQRAARGGGHPGTTAPLLAAALSSAATGFELARLCWIPWRPLAAGLGVVLPPLRPAAAIRPTLDLATDGSMAGAHALDGALPVLAALEHHGTGSAGVRLLAALQQGQTALRASSDSVREARRDWMSLASSGLPAGLQARLSAVPRLLALADDGVHAALAAPDLLGATGERTYLLVPQNPWDLRATGGFIGTAALLHVDRGRITLTDQQASDAVDNINSYRGRLYIPPPLPLVAYEHFNNWYYRDANWSPDFPTTSGLLRYFYDLGRHRRPDGVIAFDSNLLPSLLQATGPITVADPAGKQVVLHSGDALRIIDHYVNNTRGNGQLNKAFAGTVYHEIFSQLMALGPARLAPVARALDTALAQHHLLVWLANPALRGVLAQRGWDGAINQTRDDYLYVVDTNVYYNKINDWVSEHIAYTATIERDRSLRSTVTIDYHNRTTPALLRTRWPQNNPLYQDFVRVYVPLGSRLERATGLVQLWQTTRVGNKTVLAGYLRVQPGGHTRVSFTYRVPANAVMNPTTYHLTIQKQPGTPALPLAVTVRAPDGEMRIGDSHVWSWHGTQATDITLSTSLRGGRARPQPLAYDASMTVAVGPGTEIDPWTILPRSPENRG